jgi:CheY-like chemotaxis protein
MDGDVAVESAPGAGATFTVTLDLAAAPPDSPLNVLSQSEAARGLVAPGAGNAGARLLVVDDHPVNREVLVRQLGLLGIAADTAEDGVEALGAWAPDRYAAVLADLHMPVMDGYELTRRLRAAEAETGAVRTPIVAVTANAMRGEEEHCLAAGMDGYLAKPVSLARLQATLDRWLPRAHAPLRSALRRGNGLVLPSAQSEILPRRAQRFRRGRGSAAFSICVLRVSSAYSALMGFSSLSEEWIVPSRRGRASA